MNMQNPFTNGVGGVLSADIAVPDLERERAFYSAILTTGDTPLWRADLTNNEGTPVIGLGARTAEYDMLPLQWMPHFQVADVAASVADAIDLGGQEIMHGKNDDGQSQWAVLSDPFGAGFGIIPVVAGKAQHHERIGCIAWLSLIVPDASASREFYQRVVGWSGKSIECQDRDEATAIFEMQIDDEYAAADIWQPGNGKNKIPAVWLIHLPVDDLAESLQQVRQNGGHVIQEFDSASYAVVRDPVGVYLALRMGK